MAAKLNFGQFTVQMPGVNVLKVYRNSELSKVSNRACDTPCSELTICLLCAYYIADIVSTLSAYSEYPVII